MATDNREGYLKLGYEVDQGSINAVNQANAKVEASLAAVQKSTVGVTAAADQAGKSLKDAFSRSEAAIKADQKAVDDLRKSLSEAKDEADKLDKSGGGGKFNVEGLRRTGGALRQLGLEGPGEAVGKVGDLAEVAKEFKNIGDAAKGLPGILGSVATQGAALGGSLGAVAAVAGPLVIAVGAIAIAYQKFSADIDEGKKTLEGAVAGVKAYYEAIETGTTESIKRQLEAAKKRQKDEEQELATLQHARAVGFEAAQKQYGDAIARLAFSLGEGRGAFKSVDDRIEELKKNAVTRAGQIGGLERALDSSAVAANDAAEAEKTLAAERLKAIEKEITAEQQTAQLKRSGTSSQVADRIQALQDEADAINKNLPALEEEAKKSKEAAAELQRYKDRLAEIAKQQKALNDDVLPYIKAKEDEKKAYADAVKGNEEYIKNQQKYADLIATGSSEEVKKRVDSIEREKKAIQDGLPTLDALGETNEDARKKAEEYRKQLDKLNEEEGQLTSNILPLIQAREAEAKAVEKQKQQASIVEKLEDDQATIIQKAEDDRKAIIQKGEEERASIIERAARARADIEDKYGQKLIEIARNAADEAAKALTELEQKQADLRTSLGRDEDKAVREANDKLLDEQIKAQRAERDALQEHLQRLEEIRRSDYAATQKDLLDRNFLSIYQRRLSQNEQIEQENTKFGADRTKRQQAAQDTAQDDARAYDRQRRERLIAFQQQQQDAQLAYQRQLVAAKQAHDKELQLAQEAHVRELAENRKKTAEELSDLQKKTAKELQARQAAETKELAARQAGAVKELQLLEKTEAQRLEIIAKYAKKANDLIANALKATPIKRAGGGYLEAGQASMVNEAGSSGRESFNGVPLPGAGLFIPSQAGYVNPNGGGGNTTISVPMTIIGATDPVATARAVDERIVMRLKQVLRNK